MQKRASQQLPVGASAPIPHPSPASPAANRGWARIVDAALIELGFSHLETTPFSVGCCTKLGTGSRLRTLPAAVSANVISCPKMTAV